MDILIGILIILLCGSIAANVILALSYREMLKLNDKLMVKYQEVIKYWNDTLESNRKILVLNDELLSMLDRKKKFRELVEQGKNNEEIARDLNLPISSVRHIRAEL